MAKDADRPVVFLDRDGTIIKDKHYLSDPDAVELLPGAAQGLRRLRDLGAVLVVTSNQSGVGRGYFTEQDVERVTARLKKLLAAEGVEPAGFFHCPHAPEDECGCRKPATGLVERACEECGLECDLEPGGESGRCFVIGDKDADVELGENIGAATILVLTGKGRAHRFLCQPDHTAEDLLDAANWIALQLKK